MSYFGYDKSSGISEEEHWSRQKYPYYISNFNGESLRYDVESIVSRGYSNSNVITTQMCIKWEKFGVEMVDITNGWNIGEGIKNSNVLKNLIREQKLEKMLSI